MAGNKAIMSLLPENFPSSIWQNKMLVSKGSNILFYTIKFDLTAKCATLSRLLQPKMPENVSVLGLGLNDSKTLFTIDDSITIVKNNLFRA